jgi:tetratricopeptide (TPR) repeat protein
MAPEHPADTGHYRGMDPSEPDHSGGASLAVVAVAPKVFCSYGSPDREAVEAFAVWLREQGVDAWIDRWEILPGDSFIAKTEDALRDAALVLLFLSRRSEACVWSRAEAEAAIVRMVERGTRVVPVMLDADAHVPALLRSRSVRTIEERAAILASIHGRRDKPELGPPPTRWDDAARLVLEQRFTAARERGTLGVDDAEIVEEALRRILAHRVEWSERPGVCLASVRVSPDEASDVRLPLELLGAPATAEPLVVRCELTQSTTVPEVPSPRPVGGRIVLATADASGPSPGLAVLAALQQACRDGLHHAPDPATERRRITRDPMLERRGAFDLACDYLPSVTLPSLGEALGNRGERPGAAVLLLACHVHADGPCLRDDQGKPVAVDAEALAATLVPLASHLRLVVLLPIVDGLAAVTDVGIALVDAARALHRRGFAAVVTPRVPLPGQVLAGIVGRLVAALLGDPSTPPASLEVSLARVNRWLRGRGGLARLGLRLWARATDGDDTRPIVIRPYRGLLSFDRAHARFYVGRTTEIVQVRNRLDELAHQGAPRLLLLVGASGVGKSSLAQAGVVPALLETGVDWAPVIARPADDPLPRLEARLRAQKSRLLVVVDQLEEVFDAPGGHGGAAAYLQRLWSLAGDEHGSTVLATLRIDALDAFGETRIDASTGHTLEQLVAGIHGYYVCHLGREAILEVIRTPARHVGLELDDGLAERLCAETLSEPGALPMLEVALERLWQARRGRRLPASAFEDGLAVTLARQAHACLERLPTEQREHARRILVRIATGPDIGIASWRRRTTVQRLRPARPERRAAFEAALEGLVRDRLVVVGEAREVRGEPGSGGRGDVPVELAHALLLRRWEALRRWIDDDRPKLQAIRELERWAMEWKRRGTLLTAEQLAYVAQAMLAEDGDDVDDRMRRLLQASRQAIARRKRLRRWSVAAMGSTAIVLAVASFVAVTQRDKARLQFERAEKALAEAEIQTERAEDALREEAHQTQLAQLRLDQATTLARVLIDETLPKLEYVPPRSVRKEIIEGLRAMLLELELGDGDLDAQQQRYLVYLLRGDEALHTDVLDRARREYEEAFAITTALVEDGHESVRRDVATCAMKLGDVARRGYDLDAALDWFQRALDIVEVLVAEKPRDERARRQLAWSLRELADVQVRRGKRNAARGLLLRAREIVEEQARTDPDSSRTQRDLWVMLITVGDFELRGDDSVAARSLYERALRVAEARLQAHPDVPGGPNTLAVSMNKLGELEAKVGRSTTACELYRRALALREDMIKADPLSAETQSSLAVSLERVAACHEKLHELEAARELFGRSSALRRALAEADPNNPLKQRTMLVPLERLATIEQLAGNIAEARELHKRVLDARVARAEAYPDDFEAQEDLWVSLEQLGAVEWAAGNPDEAVRLFRRALTIADALAAAAPDDAEIERGRQAVVSNLETIGAQAAEAPAAPSPPHRARAQGRRGSRAEPR